MSLASMSLLFHTLCCGIGEQDRTTAATRMASTRSVSHLCTVAILGGLSQVVLPCDAADGFLHKFKEGEQVKNESQFCRHVA